VLTSPLEPHSATPAELRSRIEAERRGSPFLVYRDGDGEQAIVALEPLGERLTIGRRPGNDITLEWDAEVSRVHAALERTGADWVLADDGLSRNGTWVNGERVVGRRRLRDGDVIAVGGTALAFVAPSREGSQPTATAAGPHLGATLTPAQRRVLVALCRPYRDDPYATPATNQEIADELVVSVDAVKSTLRALFSAFALDGLAQNRKRASLAQAALRSGVVARRDL
jgi:pSer/pThr/pTyr-binding forkhead associated (FHA) protein